VDRALPEWLKAAVHKGNAPSLRALLGKALHVDQPAVHAIEALNDKEEVCLMRGVALRTPPGFSRAQLFGFEALVDVGREKILRQECQLLSSQALEMKLFERDPASVGPNDMLARRRPGGSAAQLDPCREFQLPLPDWLDPVRVALTGPDDPFIVTHERRSDLGRPDGASVVSGGKMAALPPTLGTEPDPLKVLPLRSDDLAAAQTMQRAAEFFDRLKVYGFDFRHYFRHARLPLELRPRARMAGAPDGRAVNAEVRPFYREPDPKSNTLADSDLLAEPALATQVGDQRPQLLVRLGSADIKVRQGAQTLGLAIDARWTWHEFGHVLNFATTGELEFAFAHSAGDALAAITADPDSALATDAELRGATFPWAFVPRRHDRLAEQGYCWCGKQGRLQLLAPSMNHHRHGYFAEQLLSSSLFRLYRCLGGATGVGRTPGQAEADAGDDLAIRRSASDYCVYLIMRAIALLGPNVIVPARTADVFVGALIDADLGTGVWSIDAPWPYRDQRLRTVHRHGGHVHKVIRWSFQQQGLYADPEAPDGAGLPPAVDVYIADRRPGPRGGYTPVPLRWAADGQGPWHAAADAITVDPDGQLRVHAKQCGRDKADDLSMRVWVSPADGQPLQWTALATATAPGTDAQTFQAHLDRKKAGGPLWVLAAVDCAADPSTLGAGQEPPKEPAGLTEWVANDNNLALARLG